MLPSLPPTKLSGDFDPSSAQEILEEDDDRQDGPKAELSSVEINILIYLYLLESNFSHTAYVLLNESSLPQTSLFQHFNPDYPTPTINPRRSNKTDSNLGLSIHPSAGPSKTPGGSFAKPTDRIPRGELVRKLWKGLRWEEVEKHVSTTGDVNRPSCPNPFHLLIPHTCPPNFPSSASKPSKVPQISLSPPIPTSTTEAFPPPPPSTNSIAVQTLPIAGPSKSPAITSIPLENSNGPNGKRFKRKSRPTSPGSSRNDSPGLNSPRTQLSTLSDDGTSTSRRGKEKDKKRARISETIGSVDPDEEGTEETNTVKPSRKNNRNRESAVDSPIGSVEPEDEGEKRKSGKKGDKGDKVVEKGKAKKGLKRVENGQKGDSYVPHGDIGVWTEHRDNVTCVAWNPKNNDVLATGSNDGFARLWDLHPPTKTEDSEQERERALVLGSKPTAMSHKGVEASLKNITAVSWHPDGTVLVTACIDGVGRLFTPSGQLQGIMSYGRGAITALKFSPNGTQLLAAKANYTVCLWKFGGEYNQRMKCCFESHTSEVTDVDWLDEDVFASCSNDHTIFIHRTNDKRPRYTLKGHTDEVTRIRWSPPVTDMRPEERLLASVSDDGYCMIWKMDSYPVDRGTNSRSTSPVKQTVGSSSNGGSGGSDDYFHGTGKGSLPGVDGCVGRFLVVTGSENRNLNTLEWSPASRKGRMILAAGGHDWTVKLFNASTGEAMHEIKGLESGTGAIAFSPLGFGSKMGYLAAGGWNGKFVVIDVATGEVKKEFEVDDERKANAESMAPLMSALAWRGDGQHLAIGLQNKSVMTVYLGDLAHSTTKSINGHNGTSRRSSINDIDMEEPQEPLEVEGKGGKGDPTVEISSDCIVAEE